MRIIPDDTKDTLLHFDGDYVEPSNHYKTGTPIYFKADTIEITDAELDEIWDSYQLLCDEDEDMGIVSPRDMPFSKYLKILIELKRGKMNA